MPRQSLAFTLWQCVTKETIFQASTDLMMSQQGWWQEIEIEIILGVVADELEHEPVGAWQGEQPLPPGTRSRSSLQTMHCCHHHHHHHTWQAWQGEQPLRQGTRPVSKWFNWVIIIINLSTTGQKSQKTKIGNHICFHQGLFRFLEDDLPEWQEMNYMLRISQPPDTCR